MKLLILILCWCLLAIFCWPLAILVIVLLPILWLLLLPFRIAWIVVEAGLAFLRAILFLPARLLGFRR